MLVWITFSISYQLLVYMQTIQVNNIDSIERNIMFNYQHDTTLGSVWLVHIADIIDICLESAT